MRYNWDDMKFFLELARSGRLSVSARALGCDHVTVGRRIATLESALGSALFHRTARGYVLTAAGDTLLTFAETMEATTMSATEALGRPGAGLTGKVRISAPDGLGNHFLAAHLGGFRAEYPLLTVELIAVPQILSLSPREGDISVSLSRPARGRFRTVKLSDYRLGIYASQSYVTRYGSPTRDELGSQPFIGYVDDLIFSRELDYLDEVLPGIKARLQCSSLVAQVHATRSGDGLCVLPHYIARQESQLQHVVPEVELRRSYWLNTHEDVADLPKIRAISGYIQRLCSEKGSF